MLQSHASRAGLLLAVWLCGIVQEEKDPKSRPTSSSRRARMRIAMDLDLPAPNSP